MTVIFIKKDVELVKYSGLQQVPIGKTACLNWLKPGCKRVKIVLKSKISHFC